MTLQDQQRETAALIKRLGQAAIENEDLARFKHIWYSPPFWNYCFFLILALRGALTLQGKPNLYLT